MNTGNIRSRAIDQDSASEDRFRGRHTRAGFLRRVAGLVLGGMGAVGCGGVALGAEAAPGEREAKNKKLPLASRKMAAVRRWDVITIGNLSRNRYWGESDSKGVRSAICTCTLIQGEGCRLLVDPSLTSAEEMARELDRRSGLKLRDIDTVFITHEHGDHWYGLPHFPLARWLAGPEVAAALNKTGKLAKRVESINGRICEGVEAIPTPGHTLSHFSLRFDCDGQSVAVAGDAVATRDFWRERRGYFNCVDFDLSARSMDRLSSMADIVVPGHDNYFVNLDVASRPKNSQ
jgi:glyoxylase-like metal-dependent hydrolase (beta-lactamase superfamily II)